MKGNISRNIIKIAERKLLRERIRQNVDMIKCLEHKRSELQKSVQQIIQDEDLHQKITNYLKDRYEHKFELCKSRQYKKLAIIQSKL